MEELLENEDMKKVLEDALGNESNESIVKKTNKEISDIKKNILNELNIDSDKRNKIYNSLEEYRYIDDINEFKEGSFIRWINLKKINSIDEIKLSSGAVISEIKLKGDDIRIVCKLPFGKRMKYMEILGGSCLIFQKLSDQEKIILSVLDYLNKD